MRATYEFSVEDADSRTDEQVGEDVFDFLAGAGDDARSDAPFFSVDGWDPA